MRWPHGSLVGRVCPTKVQSVVFAYGSLDEVSFDFKAIEIDYASSVSHAYLAGLPATHHADSEQALEDCNKHTLSAYATHPSAVPLLRIEVAMPPGAFVTGFHAQVPSEVPSIDIPGDIIPGSRS